MTSRFAGLGRWPSFLCGAPALLALLATTIGRADDSFDPFAKPAATSRADSGDSKTPASQPRLLASPRAGSRDEGAADASQASTRGLDAVDLHNSAAAGPRLNRATDSNAPMPRQQPRYRSAQQATRTSYNNAVDGEDGNMPQRAGRGGRGLVDSFSQQLGNDPSPRGAGPSNVGGMVYGGYSTDGAYPPRGAGNGYSRSRVRMASMQDGTPQSVTTTPRSAAPSPPMTGGEELPQGQVMQGEGPPMGEWGGEMQGGPVGPGGPGCCSGGSCCNSCCCMPLCCLFNCNWYEEWFSDLSIHGGVHGFKSPVDQGVNGDFGFQEGLNWGSPLWDAMGLGAQVGFEADHSDFSRTNASDMHRNQYFLTAGLFHRPACNVGWQYGVVYDYLNDNFVDNFTVSQIRGDLAYVFNCHEIGFWFTDRVGTKTLDTRITNTEEAVLVRHTTYEPMDLYAFYYGHHFCNGAEGRIWGGFTGNQGGMIGADADLPLSCCLAVETEFNYVIPKSVSDRSLPPESWNIAMNLVFYPGGRAQQSHCSPYRPLFNVADNSTLIVNRRVH